MDKNTPMEIKTVTSKWYSVGYTPSFDYCPSCDKQIGWKDKEDKVCHHCEQKLK
jgi:anaerobic ribonucleoside-triphosphate reductase